MFKKANFKEWFDRYKYSELAATTSALLASQFSRIYSSLTTAYLITFAEYFTFYGVIIYRSYKALSAEKKLKNQDVTLNEIAVLIRNLLFEFGYPAVLDFFFIRPFCMYWMPILTGNYFIGIILGKIIADSFFYFLSIVNYEWIKKKN
ncbi:hypothetical protein [Flavobacterium gilvum]|uniref:Uncharacterized protein n=1 Tax=Flavobacterium gilvum TaxID=1492737 RepID=A0AAC9I558_9FLAO|nr:hypothetical protein [Flavobacterium gilvum]AOW09802.1 hypothetical protein EM308_09955 [Flavobacterium gilvum]KFC58110.1 hypothetical protein FEM08_31780 [Flavobacterium gilvum]